MDHTNEEVEALRKIQSMFYEMPYMGGSPMLFGRPGQLMTVEQIAHNLELLRKELDIVAERDGRQHTELLSINNDLYAVGRLFKRMKVMP